MAVDFGALLKIGLEANLHQSHTRRRLSEKPCVYDVGSGQRKGGLGCIVQLNVGRGRPIRVQESGQGSIRRTRHHPAKTDPLYRRI